MKRILVFGGWAAISACSSSAPTMMASDMTATDMAGLGPTHRDLAQGGGSIPDPGNVNMVDNNFGSVEPNDTPAQATPLGTAMQGDIYVWVNGNNIGGSDATDYFVFKTAAAPGQLSLGASGLCWSGAVTGMSATLWKVTGGQQVLPAVHDWVGSGSCVKSAMGDAPLEASTEYLFAVQATGGAGMYAA